MLLFIGFINIARALDALVIVDRLINTKMGTININDKHVFLCIIYGFFRIRQELYMCSSFKRKNLSLNTHYNKGVSNDK